MFKKFSLLLAVLFALSAGMVQAQTFSASPSANLAWQTAASWTPAMGASGFPGQAVNNGDVTVTPSAAVAFTDAPPAFAISSFRLSGSQNLTLTNLAAGGTLTITGGLTVDNGATLTVGANTTIIVNGAASINGTLALTQQTSRVIFNGALAGSGTITSAMTAAAPNSNIELGSGVTSIPGALFGPGTGFVGVLRTGGNATLTSTLNIGATGILNLVGTLTVAPTFSVIIGNNAATAINRDGTNGNFQGAAANSVVNFNANGPTAVNGLWFASPFNGRFITRGAASTLSGTMTVGATGTLELSNQLDVAAAATLILNNTSPGSLAGAGTLNMLATSSVTLGPGFNGGEVNFDRFVSPILGTLNTGGNLTATGAATPIVTIGNAGNGSINLTGTLTIAANRTIRIAGTVFGPPGTIAGSGTFAAAAANSTVEFNPNTANGGNVPGQSFSNPWNGTIQTAGAMNLTSNLTVGASGILNLGANLTVAAATTLTLNQTTPVNTAFTMASPGLIVGAAATSVVEIGANTFTGTLPATRLGTGAVWGTGILRVLGSTALNPAGATYQIATGSFLEIAPAAVLQIATSKTLDIAGTLQRQSAPAGITTMGRINGQDNTAIVNLNTTTFVNNTGVGAAANVPGAVFGTPNFDGRLQLQQSRILIGSMRLGANSILDFTAAGNALTVNTPDTLFINPTANTGLTNPGTIVGTGTVNLGNNALAATYPTAVLAGYNGRIIVGDGISFTAATNINNPTILQLNGATTIANNQTLTINNIAANSLTGTGTIQGQTNTAILAFAAGANNNVVPGANIFGTPDALASSFSGRINTAAAMNLTGNLNMGPTSILNLGGNLTLSNTSRVLLQQTAAAGTSLPGAGKLVGQPSGVNVPEIILSTGAFITGLGSVMPSTDDITLGNGAGDFGGRLTVGSGYYVGTTPVAPPPSHDFSASVNAMGLVTGTPFTVNTPAILNIVPGATLNVLAGAGIRLNNTNSGAIGPGTGRIQGANNTAIVEIGNNFNGGTIPGNLLGVPIPGTSNIPFNGQLVVSGAATLNPGVTMSSVSLLRINGQTLSVAPGAELRLETPVNGIQGTGTITGSNSQSRITLANNFNGGTFPTARFANPMGGTLTTEGPLTMDGSYAIGTLGALNIGGNFTIPASGILTMSQSGINSFTATGGARIAGQSTSQAILGGNFNNRLLPGAAFTDFPGLLAMNSPLSLTSPLNMNNATGILDLGGVSNVLALHAHNLSVVNPIRNTSATAFIVTNGAGTLSISNATLTSVFFPIGTTNASYTPISIRSTSGTADVFRVRVRNADTLTNPRAFLGFVNREWFISGVAPTVLRGMSITPQWNADNERGTFLRFSTGIAAFSPTAGYVLSQTTATTALQSGALTVSGNLPPIAYSETPIVVFSTRPTFIAPILNPLSISGISPSSVPASNDPFTVSLSGANLNIPGNQISVFNPVNGVRVAPTTTSSVGVSLTLTLPGSLRSVPGVVTISITNANTSFTSVTFAVTRVTSPTITGITPSTTASGRAFTIQLNGTGFFANALITLNGVGARPVGITNATTAFVEIPSNLNATSNTIAIRLRNSDGQFAETTYTIGQASRPVITSVNPRAVFSNSPDTQVTINGTGFFGPGNISAFFGAQLIPVRFVSSTQVVVTVPAALLTTPGNPSIILSNSDAQNIGHVFTISERIPLGPTPRIVTVTPSVTTASFRAFSVNIEGENFNPSAVVTVLGQLATVTRTGTTGLAVQIPAGLNTTTNTYEIVIQNPDLQFTSANVRIGDRLNAPILAGILPTTTIASIQPRAFALTIRGTNFTPNAQVLWNGMVLQVVSVSATEIVVNVPDNRVGMYQLVVLNGDGQGTAPIVYLINAPDAVTEQTLPNVSVYPSPVYDNMTITAGFAAPVTVRVTVSNVIGQRVMSFTEQASGTYTRNVNMSELPTGAYIVEVSDGARRLVQKIVKY
jgi:hypothetical protein